VNSPGHEVHARWILVAISTALFCVQIDYFAMNLALPRMASDLGSTTTDLQWVISVYMLALGAFMAPAGRIGDIFGRRRTLLFGIASSLVTLAGVGVAVSSSVLEVLEHQGLSTGDGIRAILAVIAALLLPAGLAVLAITRSKNRSSAIGVS
jgi:MFS family permease